MGVLILNSIIKFYEFASVRKSRNFFGIFLLPILTLVFYLFFKVLFLDRVLNSVNIPLFINIIVLTFILVFFICVYTIYHKTLKGVFVYNDYIQIVYAITKRNLLNIKPKINYNEIAKCEIIPNSFDNKIRYSISFNYIAGSGDEYVMIETIDNKTFFFCVENQNEFVEELNKRRGL